MKLIEEEFIENLIKYLAVKPYGEVHQIIFRLINLKNMPETKEPTSAKTKS